MVEGVREPRTNEPTPQHRHVLFRPDSVADDVVSEDEGLDPVDRASADSFPASDPPSGSSPAA